MEDSWREFWMCETETSKRVSQLRDTYLMMIVMMMMTTTTNYLSKHQTVQSINLIIEKVGSLIR